MLDNPSSTSFHPTMITPSCARRRKVILSCPTDENQRPPRIEEKEAGT
jgi:hypothetical protein